MADGTWEIRYTGSPALAARFVRDLRTEGVEVRSRPRAELRDIQAAAEAVAIYLTCRGTEAAIKGAVSRFRKRFPRAEIEVRPGDDRGYR